MAYALSQLNKRQIKEIQHYNNELIKQSALYLYCHNFGPFEMAVHLNQEFINSIHIVISPQITEEWIKNFYIIFVKRDLHEIKVPKLIKAYGNEKTLHEWSAFTWTPSVIDMELRYQIGLRGEHIVTIINTPESIINDSLSNRYIKHLKLVGAKKEDKKHSQIFEKINSTIKKRKTIKGSHFSKEVKDRAIELRIQNQNLTRVEIANLLNKEFEGQIPSLIYGPNVCSWVKPYEVKPCEVKKIKKKPNNKTYIPTVITAYGITLTVTQWISFEWTCSMGMLKKRYRKGSRGYLLVTYKIPPLDFLQKLSREELKILQRQNYQIGQST